MAVDSAVLQTAKWLVHHRGFSVIPLDHPDATSYPGEPKKIGKVPALASWKPFQEAPPTDDNLRVWFGNGTARNLAIVTGTVSQIIAIDGDTPEALAWMEQTSTYLNVERGGLRESMRRMDESRSRCNPVAISASGDAPIDRSNRETSAEQATVN